MNTKKFPGYKTDMVSKAVIIFFAVLLRLLPHPPNVAPIAALSLFGGTYIRGVSGMMIPLIAMLISDFFLGFHAVMPFVYISFLCTSFLGRWVRHHKGILSIAGVSIASSILFFVVTNLGVWFVGNMYPLTFNGLVACFTAAIPFFRNTLLGDLVYTGVFFGGYEVAVSMQRYLSLHKKQSVRA